MLTWDRFFQLKNLPQIHELTIGFQNFLDFEIDTLIELWDCMLFIIHVKLCVCCRTEFSIAECFYNVRAGRGSS